MRGVLCEPPPLVPWGNGARQLAESCQPMFCGVWAQITRSLLRLLKYGTKELLDVMPVAAHVAGILSRLLHQMAKTLRVSHLLV